MVKPNLLAAATFVAVAILVVLPADSEACWRLRGRHHCAPPCPQPCAAPGVPAPASVQPPITINDCPTDFKFVKCVGGFWTEVPKADAIGCMSQDWIGKRCFLESVKRETADKFPVVSDSTTNPRKWRRALVGERVHGNLPKEYIGIQSE